MDECMIDINYLRLKKLKLYLKLRLKDFSFELDMDDWLLKVVNYLIKSMYVMLEQYNGLSYSDM